MGGADTRERPVIDAPAGRSAAGSRRSTWLREAFVLLLAIAAVALAGRLAVWQLDRASQKLALQAALDSRGREPTLTASSLARRRADVPAQVSRRVTLSGHWVHDRNAFLDNRQMDGKVGFFVVTPLRIDDSADVVLVQRGWVPRNFDHRADLPIVSTPSEPVEVQGVIAAAPARLFEFAGAASGPIRQNIEPVAFALESGLPLLPLVVIEGATPTNTGDSLLRRWSPPAVDVQTNYGYAFQWSAIGAVILFLYVWFRLIRPRRRRSP